MIVKSTDLNGVKIIVPELFEDDRGYFFESWNMDKFCKHLDINVQFVQDNHSHSNKNVLRGLHYQLGNAQGKLVRVVNGEVLDVVLDLRKKSPTFGKHAIVKLSSESRKQIWIPEGFAHGFLTISDSADVIYKTTKFYDPSSEITILWNDPILQIDWQLKGATPKLSSKDARGIPFSQAPLYD